MSQTQRYALVDACDVFVCLRSEDLSHGHETATVFGRWGETVTEMVRVCRGVNRHFGYWFTTSASSPPDEVIVQPPERQRVLEYRLSDDRLAATLPVTLTPDEMLRWTDDEGSEYDPVVLKVYEAVSEPFLPEPTRITGFLRLDGKPWPESDLTWVTRLPYELRYAAEYGHLFPGHIEEDFRKVVEAVLEKRTDVQYCFAHTGPGLETHVRVGQVTRTIRIMVAHHVEGPTFADAIANRERELVRASAEVDGVRDRVCPRCGGSGTDIPAPAPKPAGRRR